MTSSIYEFFEPRLINESCWTSLVDPRIIDRYFDTMNIDEVYLGQRSKGILKHTYPEFSVARATLVVHSYRV